MALFRFSMVVVWHPHGDAPENESVWKKADQYRLIFLEGDAISDSGVEIGSFVCQKRE